MRMASTGFLGSYHTPVTEMKRNKWHRSHQYGWHDRQRRHHPRRYRGHDRHSSREWNQRSDPHASVSGLSEQNSPATESTSSASVSTDVPELPGFYYDRKKDRYFRLLPGHNNCNPLTWESIRKTEMEEKRLKKLEEDAKAKQLVVRMGLNLTRLLQKRHSGLMKPASCLRFIQELKVSGMRKNKLDIRSLDSSIQSNFQMLLADTNVERIFAAITDKAGYKYGILNLDGHRKESQLISVNMCDNLYSTHRKGTAACWASLNGRDSHVLLCLSGNADVPGCISLLPTSIFSDSNPADHLSMLCNFRSSTVWSCAWCFNPQADKCFSTGLLNCVCVTDAVSGQKQIFYTNSSVLAQQFAHRAPVLYNGCRSGEIFSLDIRQRMAKALSWAGTTISQNSAVTSIQLLQDENYLLAADMIGKIKLWDLRTTRCVKQYEGHHNECAYLPIHPHEEEGVLLAVGQDCYTRIWSLHDGTLLRTIPSPHSISKDSIPSIVFSSQLGGRSGVPGLLMAVYHDLYHFSYSSNH
ncbi:DDB1- and CUL4-associated factor 4-like isoform X1 [Chiloscyllium punctatum]|uniref:DDB1- and CUL4-associated factor 4-like isoform X1 n=2 Tax=Chiloscyllium punctatum TaxID=137246 RepID=UPI003B63CE07